MKSTSGPPVPHVKAQRTRKAAADKHSSSRTEAYNPSTALDDYWIHAFARQTRHASDADGGKWMIFVARPAVDAMWDRIAAAVKNGSLGWSAKVSTAVPNPNSSNPNKHVICVYTDDTNDEVDIRRVRTELRNLGIVWKIGYKSDAATRAGAYANRGATRISKYWE